MNVMINQKYAVIAPMLADVVSKTMPATLASQFHSSNKSLVIVSVANWGPVLSVDLWTMYIVWALAHLN